MGPGFRYHVASLVAIFLALGTGMVIGSSYLQEAIVDGLRVQLRELNERYSNEVQPLRKENAEKTRALAVALPRITDGALDRVRTALIVTGDYAPEAREAAAALKQAGAEVLSTTVIPAVFPMRLEMTWETIVPDLRIRRPNLPDGSEACLRALVAVLVRGNDAGEIAALERAQLISADGNYRRSTMSVVLVGGASDEATQRQAAVDLPLIDALREAGVTVVGAEPREAVQSYMRAYIDRGISTVDCIDTDVGRAALVLLVQGARGSYGCKETARDGILPPVKNQQ